jgi:multidrug resistance efflux pump
MAKEKLTQDLSLEELQAKVAALEAENAELSETVAELNTALAAAEAKLGAPNGPKLIVHGKTTYVQQIPGCNWKGQVIGTAELEADAELCKELVAKGAAILTIKED